MSENQIGQAPRKAGWLREEMPGVAAVMDELSEVFGRDVVVESMRSGMRDGSFWAVDHTNGKTFGARPESQAVAALVYKSPNGLPSMLEARKRWIA